MSKRSGDKARSKKEREKKRRRRLRNQELRKATENKTAGQETSDRDGNRIVSSQLRRVTRDSKDGSDQGEGVLEIVVYRTRESAE